MRPQVEKAFADLVQALNDSPMAKRASSLDKAADGYWGRIIERGARSFENYVINKMALQGYSNDFLANIRNFDEWQALGKNAERYPCLRERNLLLMVCAYWIAPTCLGYWAWVTALCILPKGRSMPASTPT